MGIFPAALIGFVLKFRVCGIIIFIIYGFRKCQKCQKKRGSGEKMKKLLLVTILAAFITVGYYLYTLHTPHAGSDNAKDGVKLMSDIATSDKKQEKAEELELPDNSEQLETLNWQKDNTDETVKEPYPTAKASKSSVKDLLQPTVEDSNPSAEDSPQLTAEDSNPSVEDFKPTIEEIKQLPAHSMVDTTLFTDEEIETLFYSTEITDEIFSRINNISYTPNDNITADELRYIKLLHIGFDEKTYIGELIVNRAISDDILDIMKELYSARYPIESMVLVDEYGADDDKSMAANNTSAFNYRTVPGKSSLSNHSYGLAIDINPLYNPYIRKSGSGELLISPENGAEYADRDKDFPHKIDRDDLCCKLFKEHGFTWGGDWKSVKDYQHFEKN